MLDVSDKLPRHKEKVPRKRDLRSIDTIVVHCTDDNIQKPEWYAQYDIGPNHISSTGCPTITYHDLIGSDGQLYHTVPYEEETWHAKSWNSRSIAVSLMYKATEKTGKDTGKQKPTSEALETLTLFLAQKCLQFCKNPYNFIKGHRELEGTGWEMKDGKVVQIKTCPGMAVDLTALRRNACKALQTILKARKLLRGPTDGIFGPRTSQALLKAFKKGNSDG